jgi:vacuolar protein sorting-associated protein 29
MQYVICTGNVGSKESVDWLKGLSDNFIMVKGDYDEVNELF